MRTRTESHLLRDSIAPSTTRTLFTETSHDGRPTPCPDQTHVTVVPTPPHRSMRTQIPSPTPKTGTSLHPAEVQAVLQTGVPRPVRLRPGLRYLGPEVGR